MNESNKILLNQFDSYFYLMKKFLIEISDEAHKELVRLQFKRKMEGNPRTTIRDVASDVLTECLIPSKKPDQK